MLNQNHWVMCVIKESKERKRKRRERKIEKVTLSGAHYSIVYNVHSATLQITT